MKLTIKEIKRELFMLKVKFWTLEIDLKRFFRRLIHCKFGHHYMIPNSLRIEKSMKSKKGMRCTLDLKWLECKNCNYLFFGNDKDKQKWINYYKLENKNLKKAIRLLGTNRK